MLMDVRMPVMDGLEATRRISDDPSLATTRMVILTTFDLDEYVHEGLRAGASGFLLKDTMPVDLIQAVRVVAAGDALIAPRIMRRLIEEFVRRPEPAGAAAATAALDQLTDREREVLELVAKGQSNAEIADVALREPCHRQDPREPAAHETRRPRPCPARRDRLRNRRGAARRLKSGQKRDRRAGDSVALFVSLRFGCGTPAADPTAPLTIGGGWALRDRGG